MTTRITLRSQALVIEQLRLELAQANATITALKADAPSVRRAQPTDPRTMDMRQRMALAREMAMKSGRSVLVTRG